MSSVEEVLAAHVLLHDSCTCRWVVTRGEVPWSVQHRAHVAAVLAAAGIGDTAAAEARGAERALTEIEAVIQADLDDMEKYSTTLATGLYRAVRFVQMARNEVRP